MSWRAKRVHEALGDAFYDPVTPARFPELTLRYRNQLRWYMRALRDITGQPVKAACLYALEHGTFIPITEDEPIRYEEQEVGQDAQRADGRHL